MSRKTRKQRTKKKAHKVKERKDTGMPVEKNKSKEHSFAVFDVGKEKFAINLDSVTEILHTFKIVSVPHLPRMFSGVVKLRGESVPLIDLQTLLKEEKIETEIRPCLITEVGTKTMGFLVDSDVAIITTGQEKLYPLPDSFAREEGEFLEGIFWTDKTFVGILKPKEMVEVLAQWRQENEKI
jgi:purine-binding chemotaxis protein CheW